MKADERIERYFSGEMDDLQRSQFDQEVMNNPKLAEAVQNYKDLILGVKSYGLQQDIRSIVSGNHGKATIEKALPNKARQVRWWYFLMLAVAMALLYWVLQRSDVESNPIQQLYIAYYYTDPGLPTTMGVTAEATFLDGMIKYKNGQYSDALKIWNSLSSLEDDKITYYKGLCLHELKRHDAALTELQQIKSTSSYHQKALWYRSLINLKFGDKETAVNNLIQLSNLRDSIYSERAGELLTKLNN